MSKNQWAIGIDLGGSKIEVALVNSSGLLHDRLRVPTDSKKGYEAILKQITETIHQLCEKNGDAVPSAVGIGIPGQISRSSGIVHYAPNLNWHEVNLENDLSKMLDKHVRICNDVRAATENLEVLPAKLHNDSGVIGAAAFALHSMDKT